MWAAVAARCSASTSRRPQTGRQRGLLPPQARLDAQRLRPHDHGVCATYGPLHCIHDNRTSVLRVEAGISGTSALPMEGEFWLTENGLERIRRLLEALLDAHCATRVSNPAASILESHATLSVRGAGSPTSLHLPPAVAPQRTPVGRLSM